MTDQNKNKTAIDGQNVNRWQGRILNNTALVQRDYIKAQFDKVQFAPITFMDVARSLMASEGKN